MVLAQRIYSTLITEEAPSFDVPVSVWIRYVDAGAKKEYDIGLLQDKRAFQIRMIGVLKNQYTSTTTRTEKNWRVMQHTALILSQTRIIVMKTLFSTCLSKVV